MKVYGIDCSECEDFLESWSHGGGSPTPELKKMVDFHRAMCTVCRCRPLTQDDFLAIWRNMVARVGHQEVCKDPTCKHDDDPPSWFEEQVVAQFKKPGKL